MTKILRQASPNRFPVRLIEEAGYDGRPVFIVEREISHPDETYWEYTDEGFGDTFDTREAADRASAGSARGAGHGLLKPTREREMSKITILRQAASNRFSTQ